MNFLKSLLILLAIAEAPNVYGQSKPTESEEKPYIEVVGSADLDIVPDEIFINIILREKIVNKEKVTIEFQEEKLKAALGEIGINLKNLSLSDANSDYVKVKWRTREVIAKREYTLKLMDATSVGRVFEQFDKLEIYDASISKVNHTKLDSLKKVVKIKCIQAAKSKADYLLTAIGEQTGKALIVREKEVNSDSEFRAYRGNVQDRTHYDKEIVKDDMVEIQFSKIKIQAFIYVKFEIK